MSRTVNNLQGGSYWLRLSIAGDDGTAPQGPQATVVVPTISNCRTLTGSRYLDANKDCVKQGGEPVLPYIPMVATPGPYYSSTDHNGNYRFNLPLGGTYTVSESSTHVNQHCPTPGATITLSNNTTQAYADTSIMGLDVSAHMTSGPARPGFQLNYSASVFNRSYTSSGIYSFTVSYNPLLSFVSSSPAPSSTSAGTITWTGQAALAAYAQRAYSINLQVPANVGLLGTVLTATATATLNGTDIDLTNNTATTQVTITGSYDPNDKLARTSSGASSTQYLLDVDRHIDYTIRFQNTGTDTAFTVILTDTLPASLDPSTIEWGSSSHTITHRWIRGQVLRVVFLAINLPQSAVNEPRSHGHMGFRIRPRAPLQPGTVISNQANIYFDFNPPIITDPVVLTTANPLALVAAKAFLLGPYVEATQLMRDDLRTSNRVPLMEPYTALGYPTHGDGGEMTTAAVLAATGNNAIVDWVLLELRSAATPTQIVASRRALIQRDGDIVDVDGVSPVGFAATIGQSYRLVVKHRNHLGCMTSAPYLLGLSPVTIDLSLASVGAFGTNARRIMGTRAALWSGNVNGDGILKYTGSNNDRDPMLVRVGGSTPTNTATGYWREDVDLSGVVRYTGEGNDRDPILLNLGGSTPTAVLNQQLP